MSAYDSGVMFLQVGHTVVSGGLEEAASGRDAAAGVAVADQIMERTGGFGSWTLLVGTCVLLSLAYLICACFYRDAHDNNAEEAQKLSESKQPFKEHRKEFRKDLTNDALIANSFPISVTAGAAGNLLKSNKPQVN
mmetsp:Transcript_47046/g.140432  ORF Transcript_47046/g.140432 Transcript_47046/m.140432 type:complete len:136 (-) Transcript_47046:61-468(-)